MVKICETECLWNGRAKARIHTEGRTQHRNWNLKKRGGRVGLLGQPSDPNRAAMGLSVRQWALCAYGLAPLRLSFFFSSVCQNVSQSEPSKTTLLPEGASDGFVNNFDQLKGGEKKHHFNYSLFKNCQFQFGGFSVSFLLPPSPPTKQSKPEKQPRAEERGPGKACPHAKHLVDHLLPWGGGVQRTQNFVRREHIPLGYNCYCEDTSMSHHTLASVLIAF